MTTANLYCKHPALQARKGQIALPVTGTQLFLRTMRKDAGFHVWHSS